MRRCELVAGVVLVALAGCGDEASPEDTVKTYFNAFLDGDGELACKQLTGEAKREAVDFANKQLPEASIRTCEDAIVEQNKSRGEDEKARNAYGPPKVHTTPRKVTGDTARIEVRGTTVTAELRRSGGRWLISGGLFESPGSPPSERGSRDDESNGDDSASSKSR